MTRDSPNSSPAAKKSTDGSPGPTLVERIRSLAYPRSNSGSPRKSRAQNAFTDDQNPALKDGNAADPSLNQSDRKVALTSAELSLEVHINPTSIHLGEAFLDCLEMDRPQEARKIYDSLITTAASSDVFVETRLSSVKLLARLRCDSGGALKVVDIPDTQGLAALLLRTEESAQLPALSNRVSMAEEAPPSRSGSSGANNNTNRTPSQSRTRSATREQLSRSPPPLWMYPGSIVLSQDPPLLTSLLLKAYATEDSSVAAIDLSAWLDVMINVLEKGSDWEIYSYVLVHLPSQLTEISLFVRHIAKIEKLHDLVVFQLQKSKFFEPPASTGLKKGDVALCLYHTLTVLIAYNGWLRPQKMTDTVHTFLVGISMWDRTAKCCIHALTLCCHEVPKAVDRCLSMILTKMSQIISQSHLAIDVLELLNHMARLPAAYQSIGEDLQRTIFGICVGYLRHVRDTREDAADSANPRSSNRLSRVSGESTMQSPSGQSAETENDLHEYVYTLAYHIITHWFLAISIVDRPKHVGWIAKNLAWKDKSGEEIVEEQSQVTLDMMHRTAYLDLGETMRPSIESNNEDHMVKKMWLLGLSIMTIETNQTNGITYITKRQASGTTFSVYQQAYQPLPSHHVGADVRVNMEGMDPTPQIFPNHVLLQLTSTISPMPIPMQPIVLPDNAQTQRAISTFDRIDTVDGHKAGVIYVYPGQQEEREILANTAGSEAFETFLAGLGTKVKLQGATFNTQGLDRTSNMDGTHTYAWRDRVTEIVYHVPTMMPTDLEMDPQCTNKKRHIGNDFVNIIFNESGLPFRFSTFASAFNFVNIVITPERVLLPPSAGSLAGDTGSAAVDARDFFKVQVVWDASFPEVSPATTPKVVTASTLPGYVRQLALNASVFCLLWSNRGGGEYVSSWRSRHREIRRLRERYANTATSATVGYPGMGTAEDRGGARSYVEGDTWTGTLTMGGLAEAGHFLMSLDFTRWT
ncbi:MAG: hypothetical protein LQ338_004088 [Usnochroma carphineum]|nr:MAG: hypothetical protein LQ338_004088 [Usnochroma carphineum]